MTHRRGMLDEMMGDFFNDPFFSHDPFEDDPFFSMGRRQQPRRPHQSNERIEEVHDDEEAPRTNNSSSQPVVEEPDDDGYGEDDNIEDPSHRHSRRNHHRRHRNHPYSSNRGFNNDFMNDDFGLMRGGFGSSFDDMFRMADSNGNGHSYSYSSVMTSSNINGVQETKMAQKDSTGREKSSVERRIGNRAHRLDRERDETGQERANKFLRGIQEGEEDIFDQEWRSKRGSVFNSIGNHRSRSMQPPVRSIQDRPSSSSRHRSHSRPRKHRHRRRQHNYS
eukprot:gb/GECH01013151.1/.p1 GENE.gb/GECH01013151.1/~~gb/GECH01013151.1/.p1  ORF type:complete len:278 (+),score=82.42 gb/GECH01013151.1/:1-834(+)